MKTKKRGGFVVTFSAIKPHLIVTSTVVGVQNKYGHVQADGVNKFYEGVCEGANQCDGKVGKSDIIYLAAGGGQ